MIFFLYFLRNDFPYHRFAISVNKKIDNAVHRNYIKRRMKELFRLNQHLVTSRHDLWIVVKKKFDQSNMPEIERLFVDALIRIEYQ